MIVTQIILDESSRRPSTSQNLDLTMTIVQKSLWVCLVCEESYCGRGGKNCYRSSFGLGREYGNLSQEEEGLTGLSPHPQKLLVP